jgi:hypothetical protein
MSEAARLLDQRIGEQGTDDADGRHDAENLHEREGFAGRGSVRGSRGRHVQFLLKDDSPTLSTILAARFPTGCR